MSLPPPSGDYEPPLKDLEALIDRLCAISDRYERVYGIDRGGDWGLLKLQEEMGELTQSYLALTGRSRRSQATAKAEFASEVADVISMLLLLARAQGVDVNRAIAQKWLSFEAIMKQESSETAPKTPEVTSL